MPISDIQLLNGSELSAYYSELLKTDYDIYKDVYPTIQGGTYNKNNIPDEYKKYFCGSLGSFFENFKDPNNPNNYILPSTVIVHIDGNYLIYFKSDNTDNIKEVIINAVNELDSRADALIDFKKEGDDVLKADLTWLIGAGIKEEMLTQEEIDSFFDA